MKRANDGSDCSFSSRVAIAGAARVKMSSFGCGPEPLESRRVLATVTLTDSSGGAFAENGGTDTVTPHSRVRPRAP